jgi:hypothetical protein
MYACIVILMLSLRRSPVVKIVVGVLELRAGMLIIKLSLVGRRTVVSGVLSCVIACRHFDPHAVSHLQ